MAVIYMLTMVICVRGNQIELHGWCIENNHLHDRNQIVRFIIYVYLSKKLPDLNSLSHSLYTYGSSLVQVMACHLGQTHTIIWIKSGLFLIGSQIKINLIR